MTIRLPSVEELDAAGARHLEETRYEPLPDDWPHDEHGLPIPLPEPDDPDDEW